MTTLATRTETRPVVTDADLTITHPPIGTIARGKPTYLIADNPWRPWVNRAGGVAIGGVVATITTIMLGHAYLWAFATTISLALLFAFLLAGHELFEKRPTKFKAVP